MSARRALHGRSGVTLSRSECYARIRLVLPGSHMHCWPKPTHEANRYNLGHLKPRTLQKTLYVGSSQIGQPLQVVWYGGSQFPFPELPLTGQAGPS
jgi:hypothetical protein